MIRLRKRLFMMMTLCAIIFLYTIPGLANENRVFAGQNSGTKIFCDEANAKAGETFELNINMKNNPGLAAWLVSLDWDESQFELIDVDHGKTFSKGLMFDNSKTSGNLSVTWFNTSNVSDDGVLFTAKFKVLDSVITGDYTLKVSYSPENTINVDEEMIAIEVVDAIVHVNGNEKLKNSQGTKDKTKDDGLTLNYNKLELGIKADEVLKIEENDHTKWSSSDENVVIVEDGVVTPVGPGKAEITVISEDGTKKSTCEVSVYGEETLKKEAGKSVVGKASIAFAVVVFVMAIGLIISKKKKIRENANDEKEE